MEVWEFLVEVVDERVRQTFSANTSMAWREFLERAHQHIDQPHLDVRIGYRISGDARAMSYLACEYDWNMALTRVRERAVAARTRAVSMELRNMAVSSRGCHVIEHTYLISLQRSQEGAQKARGRGKGKAKEKRHCDDDIPPEPTPELKRQYDCLVELQAHLLCHAHTKPGTRTYCWAEPGGDKSGGGHRELSHEEMTRWAKHMVSERLSRQ